jgi:hypothetical protein
MLAFCVCYEYAVWVCQYRCCRKIVADGGQVEDRSRNGTQYGGNGLVDGSVPLHGLDQKVLTHEGVGVMCACLGWCGSTTAEHPQRT